MREMQTFKATLKGLAPIMFHNERLANPTDPGTRELKKLTTQRNKTDDVLEQVKNLEWRLGFYEEDGRVVVPADCVIACGIEGARKSKHGKEFTAGVVEARAAYPLGYDGPKTIAGLAKDPRFCDYRGVVVSRRRTMRARPIFRQWELPIELLFDPEIIEADQILQSYTTAGERIGLCERRPRFGRFSVEV